MVKTPKLYFSDTGLLCHLLGIRSDSDLLVHPLRSAVFENFIISEFYKYKFNNDEIDFNMLFYRDTAGREVDLIIESGVDIWLFEIKYTQTYRSDFFKHINYIKGKMSVKSADIIYAGAQQFQNVLNWEGVKNMSSLLK